MFADSGGCCHTKVAVDVDFANSHTCGFAKHIFGNAFCAGHTSAVLFNGFDVFLRNAGRTVQYDGEAGQTFADFFKDVKAQTRRGLELECAVAGADCDCKGVDARAAYELFNLVGVGIASVLFADVYRVFDACQLAEFRLDNDAVVVSVLDDFRRDFDIFFKRVMRRVNHNRSKATVNAGFAKFETVAVIEVHYDGQSADFRRRLDKMTEIYGVCVLSCARGYLQDNGSVFFGASLDDALDGFHIVDVKSADCVTAFIRFLEHFGGCNYWHK